MAIEKDQIKKLLVNPKGKSPSVREVTSELRVGRIYKNYPGYRIEFNGFELDKSAFSNLKYLVGNGEVYSAMQRKENNKEEHFLRMAIQTSKTHGKRLNTEIPLLTQHPDVKEVLFEEGLLQAKEILKSRYPEDSRGTHPYHDLVNINKKLDKPETLILLKKQLDENPRKNKTLKEVIKLNENFFALSSKAPEHLLKTLYDQMPELFIEIAVKNGFDQVVDAIKEKSKRYSEISNGM